MKHLDFCTRKILHSVLKIKKEIIGKLERPKGHPIWAAHPHTHLST